MALSSFLIYLVQRLYLKVKREKFLELRQQEAMFRVWETTMSMFHDGILYVNDKEVKYANNMVLDSFEVPEHTPFKSCSDQVMSALSQAELNEEDLENATSTRN